MFYTIADDLVFYQIVKFYRKYSNSELKFYQYFYSKTGGIYPEFIVIVGKFLFFFVKKKYYFISKNHLDAIRREVKWRKILIVSVENVFIKLIFSLFPDLYIHDIALEFDEVSGQRKIILYFLTFKERGIALGRGAEYIKSVNKMFKKYVIFENNNKPIEIKCKYINQ